MLLQVIGPCIAGVLGAGAFLATSCVLGAEAIGLCLSLAGAALVALLALLLVDRQRTGDDILLLRGLIKRAGPDAVQTGMV
jgi:hypothetical protein